MKQMEQAAEILAAAKEAIETIREEEEEAFDNLPESIHGRRARRKEPYRDGNHGVRW